MSMKATIPCVMETTGDRAASNILSPDEEKRLLRRIDGHLLPLLLITYGLEYLDKTSLSYSAILGLREDLHLVGNEYSWASSIFYVGYLAASYPISLGFVRLPLGKYLTFLTAGWGVVLTLHVLATNYASIMILRTFLGVFESGMGPGFSLITGMWYTPKEHASRHSVWFAGNFIASLIGAMIAYGILSYEGGFSQWKLLFLVFGLITITWSMILWRYLPDSPQNARFLSPTEREFASLRPKKFQRTTQTRKWNHSQFIGALKDPKSWWFFAFALLVALPNSGITNFSTLIIKGFGYDNSDTILMGLPAAAFQLVTVIVTAWLTSIIRRSRLIAVACVYIIATAGVLMIKLLPEHQRLRRLAGFWLVTCTAPSFPLLLSLCASNTAGFTKKSVTVTMIIVGFCVGSLVGPQFFISSEAPDYHTAYTAILACFAIIVGMAVILRRYLDWQNRKRDTAQGVHIDGEERRRVVDLNGDGSLAHVDETDVENKSFRYIL